MKYNTKSLECPFQQWQPVFLMALRFKSKGFRIFDNMGIKG